MDIELKRINLWDLVQGEYVVVVWKNIEKYKIIVFDFWRCLKDFLVFCIMFFCKQKFFLLIVIRSEEIDILLVKIG